jgi:ribosome-interacting GTPase 1
VTPDTAEEPKDRWIRLLDRACRELTKVYRFRIVYTDVGKIIEENGTLPDSEIFALIQDGYAYMQALAVRRQVDWKDTRVESLGRVLHEMIKHPDEATAAGFAVADIEADAQRLWVDTATVRAYVDQMLAHSDQRHPAELPTLKHVHDAIDLILDTFQRTYAKLTGQWPSI